MALIPLTQGLFTIVDDDIFEYLNQWKWYANKMGKKFRVVRNLKPNKVYMHRVICPCHGDMEVDHINGDTLDNRRANLRACSHHQNSMNTQMHSDNASGVKGVWFHKKARKWQAGITVNAKSIYLGLFRSKLDASLAYDKAARYFFGEFARITG